MRPRTGLITLHPQIVRVNRLTLNVRGASVTVHMEQPTAQNDWRAVLKAQGRSIAWLADQTGRPRRTVYAYSQQTRTPPAEWLAKAYEVLGVDVAA